VRTDWSDVAPSDFLPFGYVNDRLKGETFETADELLSGIFRVLGTIENMRLESAFQAWMQRLKAYIRTNGEYVG
jgi:hypothetical protein